METWLDSVNIRLMRESDLPLIEWGDEYVRYRKIYREVYRNFLAGRAFPWIAEIEKYGVIGQVFLTEKQPDPAFDPEQPYMFLSSFRVKPDFRNRGLGTLLLKICEVTARDRNIHNVFLNCAKTNKRCKAFYERNGFTVLREDPGKWSFIDHKGAIREEVEPAWTMVKKIETGNNLSES
ncbi:MAG TPA: GNAT family N-acetyltransferase [Flexilinea sp.]|nr:GNAT family N-acetyltransferase [Flexilinea sp.]HQN63740.1 GNAT family N-acetyltransferase [Flexilinea sp.]